MVDVVFSFTPPVEREDDSNFNGVDSYEVRYHTGTPAQISTVHVPLSDVVNGRGVVTVTGLPDGTDLYFQVAAVDTRGLVGTFSPFLTRSFDASTSPAKAPTQLALAAVD